jgi:hypothetical protein
MDILEQDVKEVAITGFSLGGLMSCYASSYMPAEFQRAFCMSPSVWWNIADLADIIETNFEVSGIAPKSVVMHIGTEEGVSYMTTLNPPTVWTDCVDDVLQAWQSIGLGNIDDDGPTDDADMHATLNSNLVYFQSIGGVHSAVSWADAFVYGLPLMYASDFRNSYMQQRNMKEIIKYPSLDVSTNSEDGNDPNPGLVAGISIVSVILIATWIFCCCYFVKNKNSNKDGGANSLL